MDTTMFELRSFVHHRLYAAAEEILGEVEKIITLALNEAEVNRSKEEVESLRKQQNFLRQKSEAPPTNNTEASDQCEATLVQESPEPTTLSEMKEDSDFSLRPEVPGPSETNFDMDSNNLNYCMTEFKMSQIKEEQKEHTDDSQKPEIVFLSPEIVKIEQDPLATGLTCEMPPVSPDCFATQSEDNDSDEDRMKRKGINTRMSTRSATVLQGQSEKKRTASADEKFSAKIQKDRSFCHLCGKSFQYIGSLMKHIKTHERKVDCTVCAITFQSTEALTSHLQFGHNKTHMCDVCGKIFANARRLRLHKKIHEGIKEFECKECGKLFLRKEHLIIHVRTHSGEKPYHCDICGKAFSQSQNLTIHKRCHSGEKPYHCGMCGKLFNTSSHLKTHMRYHSGEKPYPCDICGKRFRQSGQVTRHRMTHTGERPYGCHVCGMRYRFAPNLKMHLQTHEREAAE